MTIYINWKLAFAYETERKYIIHCLADTNKAYSTSLTLPDADKLVIEEDNVPIHHVGPDTIQILDSSDTEIADKIVEFPKRTGNSADAWKEMLKCYLLLWQSLFHIYYVHGSCSFCCLFDEKPKNWEEAVADLAKVAPNFPQTAYSGLQKSLQQEWQFVQRVTKGMIDPKF
jgi:hypothetical protein